MAGSAIEFYFDLSSPYAYLTSIWIDDLAGKYNRKVNWLPMMLGVAFKETGMKPLFHQPLRGPYGVHDFQRTARLLGVQAVVPKEFPYISLMASRGFYWLLQHHSEKAVPFAKAAFERFFVDGVAPVHEEEIKLLAQKVDVDGDDLFTGCSDPQVKERLKEVTAQAIEKGVFGAPYIIVDGEPFWGNDRRDQIEHWLKTGGW